MSQTKKEKEIAEVITLGRPIQAFGETITTLEFRRPTVKDLRAMDAHKGEVSSVAAVIASCCDIPMSAVDMMDAPDFFVASEVVQRFLPGGRQSGETG